MSASPLRLVETVELGEAGTLFPIVPRQQLVERMLTTLQGCSQLLQAPPGWGKSGILALLNAELVRRGSAVEHLPIDATAQTLVDASGAGVVLLIDDVADRPEAFVAALHELLREGRGRCILATAMPTGLAVQRLAMSSRLRVWHAPDLAANVDDVRALLDLHGHLDVFADQIDAWAEGSILAAAFSARSGIAPRGLPMEIAAYFEETGYKMLEPAHASAVALSSILDGFDRGLATDVTGMDVVAIAQTHGLPLFQDLHAPGRWRWHRLYRAFLRERAAGVGRTRRHQAHACAADLLAQVGRHADAAAHAIETGNTDLAAAIIDRGARVFIAEGRIADALTWFGSLQASDRARHPRIGLFHAVALILSGARAEAATAMAATRALYTSAVGEAPDWLAEVEAHARFQVELDHYFRHPTGPELSTIDQLIADAKDGHPVVRGEALLLRGLVCERRGDWSSAVAAMDVAEPLLRASASWYALASGVALHAEALVGEGAPERARIRLTAFIDEVVEQVGTSVPALGIARTCLAEVAWAMGEDGSVAEQLAQAAPMLKDLRNGEVNARTLLLRARLARAAARTSEAAALASEALVAVPTHAVLLGARIRAFAAIVLDELGQCDEATALVDLARAPTRVQVGRASQEARAKAVLALARARLIVARNGDLGPRLSEVAEAARSLGLAAERIEAKVASAVAQASNGERERALRTIREAAGDARRTGLWRALIDHGGHHHDGLLDDIGARKRALPSAIIPPVVHSSLVDLTAKEQEVLTLVASGLSNAEIADELFASVATIKWHVRNLLAKLEASSRSAAVARARIMGLLR